MACVDQAALTQLQRVAGGPCFVSTEAIVAVTTILAGLIAVLAAAATVLVQTTMDKYSLRLPLWSTLPSRAKVGLGLVLLLFLGSASVAIFGLRGIWLLPGMNWGLRAD